MSEEQYVGRVCCIPKRTFVLLVSLQLALLGAVNIFMLFSYTFFTQKVAIPSCRSHECLAVFSCQGMQEASFHIREVVTTLFGTVAGCLGVAGCFSIGDGFELYVLALYQVCSAIMQGVLLLGDWIFATECCSYSRNTMEMGLFWPIPNLPISHMLKAELRSMTSYPMDLVHNVAEIEVWALDLFTTILMISFHLFTAKVIQDLVRFHFTGPLGMGANYSLQHWQRTLAEKARFGSMLRNTREMAAATWQDVDWRGEELAQGIPAEYSSWGPRPGHHSHWQSFSSYGSSGQRSTQQSQRAPSSKSAPGPSIVL
mmetsp:Transcript_5953/g.13100  ORF Transcript_5953/g.13100 Transcript_5953/m.13100 type:complete len:313 (+) Transcript_5953:138-1076(+)